MNAHAIANQKRAAARRRRLEIALAVARERGLGPIPQKQLAYVLKMSQPAVSRALAALRNQSAINV